MKTRLFGIFLAALAAASAMTGCRAGKTAGSAVEHGAESVMDTVKQAVETTAAKNPDHALTMEEAESIALDHAGVSADQATAMHTQYEIEHGIPQYDVEFHIGTWEYAYEIHADTGDILSYSKDD